MKNAELFSVDPRTFTIPNDGVTTIQVPKNQQEWDVLEFELRSFVCEGEYKRGLDRILTTFFSNLDTPKQPAVWISGFYGSGKSHLARVLEYLWKDIQLPNGASARSLVELPLEIKEHLTELQTHSRRAGGLWSAAGTLRSAAGPSVRLAVLAIAFQAAGLPEDYRLAKFVLWLKQNGFYDAVKDEVEHAGKQFDREIRTLYVSPHIAGAVLKVYPGFANSEADARELFKNEYPKAEDISNEEFALTLEYVLELQSSTPGKLPLTLLVLDELQEYVKDDSDRIGLVQEVVQVCTARFGSKVLFVGTGQSALEAHTNLSRLKDRFTVKVQLDDKDVERVVRNVILRKKADKTSHLQDVLDKNKGEIDRHLQGTNIGAIDSDNDILVADYPLLPTRRRFWEKVLRAIDIAGTAGQLRTQLRVTHEASKEVADKPVGTVVSADVVYWQQEPSMLQSGLLLREVASLIGDLDDGTDDGILRSRLCAAIFVIGKLPTEGAEAPGVKATTDTLADLLIEDLTQDSADLRNRIPSMLEELVENGTLMLIDNDEYRLQTREGSEWEADFNRRFASIRNNDTRLSSERSELFREEIAKALKGVNPVQGRSKTPRKLNLFFGLDVPNRDDGNLPIWVRDEWNVSEKTVREDAQRGGIEDPLIYVLLPRVNADDLKVNLARYLAAKETVETRHNPTTHEGFEAIQSMKAKRDIAHNKLVSSITNIVNKARIYQGGGNLLSANSLVEGITMAVEASLVRMFPNFKIADHESWHTVIKKAREGNPDPLSFVEFKNDVDKHPVCQEILKYIGSSEKKGAEIRSHFMGSEFGWPRDAVDGAIMALLSGGHFQAIQNGQEKTVREISVTQIKDIKVRCLSGPTPTAGDRIKVRKLIVDLKVPYKSGAEKEAIPDLISRIYQLIEDTGGNAPLPEPTSLESLETIGSLSGNDRFLALAESQEDLLAYISECKNLKKRKEDRWPRWQILMQLAHQAKSLPDMDEVYSQIDAIEKGRALLSDPDPCKPLIVELTKTLRKKVTEAHKVLGDIYKTSMEELEKAEIWKALDEKQRQLIIQQERLIRPGKIDIKTEEYLLEVLNAQPLETWQNQIEALPQRFERAKTAAAKILEPKVVQISPKTVTLRTEEDLSAYLDELRIEVSKILKKGNPVVITRHKTD